jgi:hypothetical protein
VPGSGRRIAADERPPILKPLPEDRFRLLGTNTEMRWESLRPDASQVPNEAFFVRNHTATPLIDANAWRLRLFGTAYAASRTRGGRWRSATSSCSRCRRAR